MLRKKRKKKDQEKKEKKKILSRQAKNAIAVILLFALAFLSGVAFFDKAGIAGRYFLKGSLWLLGGGAYLIPLFFIIAAVSVLAQLKKSLWITLTGSFLLLLTAVGFLGIFSMASGGKLGYLIGSLAIRYLDRAGAFIVLVALLFVSLILVFNLSFGFLFRKSRREGEENTEREEQPSQGQLEFSPPKKSWLKRFSREETKILRRPIFHIKRLEETEKASAPSNDQTRVDLGTSEQGYHFPSLTLLTAELNNKEGIKRAEINNNIETIKNTLESFDIQVAMGEVSVGPTVTQYTLKPAQGIKLSQIVALQNDLSLALAAHPIRIEAPIPGKSWVGIEVPNKFSHLVKLRNLLEDAQYRKVRNYLTIPLGRNVAGKAVYDNLERMPHLLIAGATGTGKSVAIHNILISFLYQNSPRTLRLILVDPKRVELTAYNGIPHLLTPVITKAERAINSLKWAISEMERRYELLSEIGARDILSYNEKVSKINPRKADLLEKHKALPYIVIVIDELADIMINYARETEAAIVRLAQMARAVGIHLILSTQRPSVNVITGLIKANITFRIAFQVASQVDSRTIIDMAGAEKLLGNGDMLYQTGDSSKPKRIQGAFIAEREIRRVVEFLKKQEYEENFGNELEPLGQENLDISKFEADNLQDDLYQEAKKVVIEANKASASLLQRRLRIGYSRAARILDMLEHRGIIGPPRGSKAREVIVKRLDDEL